MLGMKNCFYISDSIEIREVDIAGVACINIYIQQHISLDEPILDRHGPYVNERKSCDVTGKYNIWLADVMFNVTLWSPVQS